MNDHKAPNIPNQINHPENMFVFIHFLCKNNEFEFESKSQLNAQYSRRPMFNRQKSYIQLIFLLNALHPKSYHILIVDGCRAFFAFVSRLEWNGKCLRSIPKIRVTTKKCKRTHFILLLFLLFIYLLDVLSSYFYSVSIGLFFFLQHCECCTWGRQCDVFYYLFPVANVRDVQIEKLVCV